jgi:hypothetical protein
LLARKAVGLVHLKKRVHVAQPQMAILQKTPFAFVLR